MIYTWQLVLFISYGIPLFCLYVVVIIQLICLRDFKAPFFRIATILGITDLLMHLSIWGQMKLPWCPITGPYFIDPPFPYSLIIVTFFAYYLPKVREILVLASAFNRFTAISLPHKQKEFWHKWLWRIIAIALIWPLCLTAHILFGTLGIFPFYITEIPIDSYVIDVNTDWFPLEKSMTNLFHTFITSCISLFCNLSTLYHVYTRNQIRKKQANGFFIISSNKTEVNLLIVSLWDFVLDLLYTAHQITMYTFVIRGDLYNPWFDRIFLLTPWMFDIMNLSRPFWLILMCKQMQKALLLVVKRRRLIPEITHGGQTVTVTITSAKH